ncbi:MAG: chromate transporter [Acholeplasmataceae bacterium]
MKKDGYLDIFITFFKIGLFTFGGGYAMIAVMQKEVVENKKWIDEKTMLDLVAISQSTPGPFAINGATFIGYYKSKFLGSLLATIGVALPSLIVIMLISIFLIAFQDNIYIQNVLKGIAAGISVLIFKAWFMLQKQLKVNVINISLIVIAVLITLIFPNFSVIYLILITALASLIHVYLLRGKVND